MEDSLRIAHVLEAADEMAELVLEGSVEMLRGDRRYFALARILIENIG